MKKINISPSKYRITFVTLSLISLVLTVIGSMKFLFYEEPHYKFMSDEVYYTTEFGIKSADKLFLLLFGILASALLFVYFMCFYSKKQKASLVLFSLLAVCGFNFVSVIRYMMRCSHYISWVGLESPHLPISIAGFVLSFITLLFFVLFLIKTLKNKASKGNSIFISAHIFALLFEILSVFDYHNYTLQMDDYHTIILFVGRISLYATIFMSLTLDKNIISDIKTIKRVNAKKKTVSEETPCPQGCNSLEVLKEKYELGIISEEEYQKQRIDIISKL